MKTKTSELIGRALDWAVALADGHKPPLLRVLRDHVALPQEDDPMWCDHLEYSTDWAQGGPIIEQEEIGIKRRAPSMPGEQWEAMGSITARGAGYRWGLGPTPLIAAMRCFVHAKFGDEVDVPEELL